MVTTIISATTPTVEGFGAQGIFSNQSQRVKPDVSGLRYRSHPHPQTEEQNHQHEQAKATLTGAQQPDHHVASPFHTLWASPKSRRARKQAKAYEKERKEQVILDNYLESIDRRYRRMHKSAGGEQETGGVTSAWQWLTSGKENSCAIEEQRKQEDAIHVLGLAKLASKQLLQRHHLPIPEHRVSYESSMAIDIEGRAYSPTPETAEGVNADAASSSSEIVDKMPTTLVSTSNDVSSSNQPDLVHSLTFTALQCMRLVRAHAARILALSRFVHACMFDVAKLGGKAASTALAATANMVTMNGGAKYTMHFASFLAISCLKGVHIALRPLTKA